MNRRYSRYSRYLSRKMLRSLGYREPLIIRGMSGGAVRSARVTCSTVGRERRCFFAIDVQPEDGLRDRYKAVVTRMSLDEAAAAGLLRRPVE